MRFSVTEKLIQRQINHWSRLREVLREQGPPIETGPGPVITISRLAGSGGRTLAAGLGDRLGLTVHDHSIVERIARTRKLSPELVALLDEHDIRQSDLWVRGVLENRLFLKEQYLQALTETIEGMAAARQCRDPRPRRRAHPRAPRDAPGTTRGEPGVAAKPAAGAVGREPGRGARPAG
jgi:hypothetical protein